jgi:hypothetical protein
MTTKRYCLGLSVRGAIRNHMYLPRTQSSLVGYCTDDETGRILDSDEIFEVLCDYLKAGKEVIPYGKCDRWDWENGCPGHEEVEEPSEAIL